MIEGLLTAADAVERETGREKSNVLRYCVGGTLLRSTLAYLAARGEAPFRSATFLTTQVEFRRPAICCCSRVTISSPRWKR